MDDRAVDALDAGRADLDAALARLRALRGVWTGSVSSRAEAEAALEDAALHVESALARLRRVEQGLR